MTDPWRRLSYYESADFVGETYQLRHDYERPPSQRKVVEITSHMVQGRQYFEAARGAGELARPLLLYYGVLALTRGLILSLDRTKHEAHLAERHGVGFDTAPTADQATAETPLAGAHGVEVDGWGTLRTGGGRDGGRIGAVALTLGAGGTFAELCSATANTRRSFIPLVHQPTGFYQRKPGLRDVTPTTLSLKDVLRRVPELDDAYETVFGELPSVMQVFPELTRAGGDACTVDLRVVGTKRSFPSVEVVAEALGIPTDRHVSTDVDRAILEAPSHLYRFVGPSLRDLGSAMPGLTAIPNQPRGRDMHSFFVIAPMPDGSELSHLSLVFLLSYSLGMLVRYYPTTWTHLSGRVAGDRVYPLVRIALDLIAKQFPRLVLEALDVVKDGFDSLIPNPYVWSDDL
jgi:hypothetical protein